MPKENKTEIQNGIIYASSVVCQSIIISRGCAIKVDLFDPFSFFQTDNGFRNILQMFINLGELFQFPKAQEVGGMLRKSKHLNSLFLQASFSTNFKAWFSKNFWLETINKRWRRNYFSSSWEEKEEREKKFHKLIFKWTSKENPLLHKAPFL